MTPNNERPEMEGMTVEEAREIELHHNGMGCVCNDANCRAKIAVPEKDVLALIPKL